MVLLNSGEYPHRSRKHQWRPDRRIIGRGVQFYDRNIEGPF